MQAPKDSFNAESLSTFVTFQNQTYDAHFTIKRPIINIVIRAAESAGARERRS